MQAESSTIRLFVCVELPYPVTQRLADLQKKLRKLPGNISWTRMENAHLTLKFLGESPRSKIGEIKKVLTEVATETKESEVLFDKTGAFPSLRKPRVFWIGCSQEFQPITTLANQIDARLAKLGFSPEKRSYRPHLTLGRVRSGDVSSVVDKIQQYNQLNIIVPVQEFTLMRSQLTPRGAHYTPLAKFAVQSETVGEE